MYPLYDSYLLNSCLEIDLGIEVPRMTLSRLIQVYHIL